MEKRDKKESEEKEKVDKRERVLSQQGGPEGKEREDCLSV